MPGAVAAPDPAARGVQGSRDGSRVRLAVVVARWNDHLTSRLLEGARRGYAHCGIPESQVAEVWVPGSFELPLVCRRLAASGSFDAVIALGVVVRGETTHYDLVSEAAAVGVREAAAATGIPVIFGVLTTDTIEQAVERAGTKAGNKGFEAAVAAIEMAELITML